jgi:hypothetical protein
MFVNTHNIKNANQETHYYVDLFTHKFANFCPIGIQKKYLVVAKYVYCIVLYCIVLYCIVLYCIVLIWVEQENFIETFIIVII